MTPVIRLPLLLGMGAALLLGCRGGADAGKPGGGGAQQSKTGGSDRGSNGADTGGQSGGEAGGGDAGVPVGTVRLEPADQAKAGIRIGAVSVRRFPQQLAVAGQVVPDERHTAHIGARADAVVERVLVLPGDTVRAGQTLAWLHSHAVHETAGALAQAYAAVDRHTSEVKFAELNRDRYQRLLALQAASEEEAQRAGQELKEAQQHLADGAAAVRMEREHLSELLQVPPETLTAATLYRQELIPIRAEGAGSVMERNVTPGQVLVTGQQAFTISNLATVWVLAAVNEKELAKVHLGQAVRIEMQGLQATGLRGTVAMLGDQLDPQTRTVPVRVVVPNPRTQLRPGMFVTAKIDGSETEEGVYVPEAAVQDVNGLQAVFVTADDTNFAVRAVELGERASGMVRVVKGLSPKDRIVTDGAFMVKSELLKGSVGEG